MPTRGSTAGAHSNYRHVGTVIAQKWFGYRLYTQSWKGHDMYHNSATPTQGLCANVRKIKKEMTSARGLDVEGDLTSARGLDVEGDLLYGVPTRGSTVVEGDLQRADTWVDSRLATNGRR